MQLSTFTYKCVDLEVFCDYFILGYDNVVEKLNDSIVSWGTNDDTLVSVDRMFLILGYDAAKINHLMTTVDGLDGLYVALGS